MIELLDHGYIKLVEHWGSDERIVETARMSTDKGFLGWGPIDNGMKICGSCGGEKGSWVNGIAHTTNWFDCDRCNGTGEVADTYPGDEKLLRYLYEHKHSTPFEFAGVSFEVQAPIMVFREWHRHRTQAYSEISARYTPLPDLYYMPSVERLMLNSKTNKQAGTIKGAPELTEAQALKFRAGLANGYSDFRYKYKEALDNGVPKELARCGMPVGHYSRMRAQAVLRNWLAFMTLRSAPNAQWEIRQYSNAINKMLTEIFPRTMELFNEEKAA